MAPGGFAHPVQFLGLTPAKGHTGSLTSIELPDSNGNAVPLSTVAS